jgi:hypothetical protein
MESTGYVLASATPLILLGLRIIALRRLSAGWGLLLDLALLVISVPIGIALVGQALHFPANVGDHSPGIGVALFGLMAVWALCVLAWLTRLAWFAFRKLASAA